MLDDSAIHPCPERHEDQVIDVFAHAEAELAPSRRVGVVLDSDRQPRAAAQLFLEGYAFDRLEVGGTKALFSLAYMKPETARQTPPTSYPLWTSVIASAMVESSRSRAFAVG